MEVFKKQEEKEAVIKEMILKGEHIEIINKIFTSKDAGEIKALLEELYKEKIDQQLIDMFIDKRGSKESFVKIFEGRYPKKFFVTFLGL